MEPERERECFTCKEGPERIDDTEPDDAIERYLDNLLEPNMTVAQVLEALPETVVVYGYAHQVFGASARKALASALLEDLLERLDEEYADPDNDGTVDTEPMRQAAHVFIDAVLAEYTVWTCDQVSEQEVEVLPWVKEHRPDWLEDEGAGVGAKEGAKEGAKAGAAE